MATRMNWERLICDTRLGLEHYKDNKSGVRSDFERDYDRLIFSSPFRRLQNKTQVFPLPGSIFVHNRLTHSLEVSCVPTRLPYAYMSAISTSLGETSCGIWARLLLQPVWLTILATHHSVTRAKKPLANSSAMAMARCFRSDLLLNNGPT